jgi:hypothetical protein
MAFGVAGVFYVKAKAEAGARPDARRGRFILTVSGIKFYILDPKPEEVVLGDVAHHLAIMPRWGGASQILYPVASHVLRVRDLILWVFENAPEWGPFAHVHPSFYDLCAAFGLLHDAHEYVLGDVPRPIKAMLLGWDGLVAPLDRAIFMRFFGTEAMPPEIAEVVSWADDLALEMEATSGVIVVPSFCCASTRGPRPLH